MNWYQINGEWADYSGNKVPSSPIQSSAYDKSVPRVVAEEAYKEYAAMYGTQQSFDRLCERGGFGASEIATLLYRRIKKLEAGKESGR